MANARPAPEQELPPVVRVDDRPPDHVPDEEREEPTSPVSPTAAGDS